MIADSSFFAEMSVEATAVITGGRDHSRFSFKYALQQIAIATFTLRSHFVIINLK
jgi:hypothetical protein